jgi:hypothetical protein
MVHPQALIQKLIAKIQPIAGEREKAMLHSITVRSRLNKSFDLKKFTKIGSHSRGTAIRRFSDVDFMAVLARNEAKWGGKIVSSSTVLNRVRDDLTDRYPQTTVRRDLQAVVIDFGGGQHAMDVVPAIFLRFMPNVGPLYLIPDGYDGWIETSPEIHNKFIMNANVSSGSKLVKVIQLIKWWTVSRTQSIPIQSFHIEMLLATEKVCSGIKSYTQCLYDTFKLLADRECRGLRDPLGISGVIYTAKTETQWEEINNAVNYALEHSRKALYAESWRDFEETKRQWNIVFNWNM